MLKIEAKECSGLKPIDIHITKENFKSKLQKV